MELFDSIFVRISLDEEVPCLEWIGKQFIPSAQFRESEQKSLELFREYKARFPRLEWFVDARSIGPIAPDDTRWVAQDLLPEFLSAGLKKEAFLVPTSSVGKLVLTNYESQAGGQILIQVFDSEGAAKQWLRD
jgi:hypothetical protein